MKTTNIAELDKYISDITNREVGTIQEHISKMTNQEAADIIKKLTLNGMYGRRCGKTWIISAVGRALFKACYHGNIKIGGKEMSKIEEIFKIIDNETKTYEESMNQPDVSNYTKKQFSMQKTTLTRLRHKIDQMLQESPFAKDDKELDKEQPTKYRTIMTKYRGGGFLIANQYYHEYSKNWKNIDNDHMCVIIHTPNQINNFIKVFNDTDKNTFSVEIVLDEWETGSNNKIKRGKKLC